MHFPPKRCAPLVLVFGLLHLAVCPAAELPVYVGTYTSGGSQGIYLLRFDPETGRLTRDGLAAESVNPSFLAVHPHGKTLYVVNETATFDKAATGAVSAFAIDPRTHRLKLLNQKPSGGAAPCHLVVDATGKYVLVANYGGGSVSVIRIEDDGSLGHQSSFVQHRGSSVNLQRQAGPHAHSINLDAANKFAVAADLGADQLFVYAFDPNRGSLTDHGSLALEPGAGPRHLAFHPGGKHAYVINELHSTMTVMTYDAKAGNLRHVQTISTLPEGFAGKSFTAEVRVSPNGKFVFGSNRGHDSIAVFLADEATGRLERVQIEPIGGKTPRNFVLDPDGHFLLAAGQSTNNIVVFRVDARTGMLTRTPHEIEVPTPVCLRFGR